MPCSQCEIDCGGSLQPALIPYKGKDYCDICLKKKDPRYHSMIVASVAENDRYKSRVRAGTYMVERQDALGYGKKKK